MDDVDGVRRLYGFAELVQGTPILIGLGVPVSDLFAETDRLFASRLVLLLAVFVGAASLAWIGGEVTIRRRRQRGAGVRPPRRPLRSHGRASGAARGGGPARQ